MKRIAIVTFLLLFALISCDRNETLVKTSVDTVYDDVYKTIQFNTDGGKDTVDIPFGNCYLHYVRNNDSVLFFYLMEPDYATLDSIIDRRSIIVRPTEIDPEKGFNYFEWDWFSVELKEGKVFISVKENDTRSDRIAEIIIPGKDVGPSLRRLEIKICQE